MTQRAVIYTLPSALAGAEYVTAALSALKADADYLIIVGDRDGDTALAGIRDADHLVFTRRADLSMMAAYQQGLAALPGGIAAWPEIVLTGAHVYGPLVSLAEVSAQMTAAGAAVYAAYPQRLAADPTSGVAARLDFVMFGQAATAHPGFSGFWAEFRPTRNQKEDFKTGAVRLSATLADAGLTTHYPVSPDVLEARNPSLDEVHVLAAAGAAALPVSTFQIDPLLADRYALDLKLALANVRARSEDWYRLIVGDGLSRQPLRDHATRMDEYRVLAHRPDNPDKKAWSFGPVAVFIHAFYVEMMPEFWALISRVPGPFDLYLSTSTAVHKDAIEAFLADKGFPAKRAEVRVVARNRGRDMSSLFITFRDVVLSGRYEVALRLHSKRTPQTPPEVSKSFKAHLFDNLIADEGYASNLLDLMEADPDIGLIIPPAVHIGFGTLGHSWFSNRKGVEALAQQMGLTVPLDRYMPVAPYGTMYWFRTAALRQMFAHEWAWEDYNEEPNHVDGGLAHNQERLIGYTAQQNGYRVMSVMTPEQAARNYAKLEYKAQLLASRLPHGNMVLQSRFMTGGARPMARIYDGLTPLYFWMTRKMPWLRRMLGPFVSWLERALFPPSH